MKLIQSNPNNLIPNPWNSNRVSKENLEKLKNSVDKLGHFKPIICRELEDGTLQILGGYHRNEAAKANGLTEVPVINLGEIDDVQAKEITLVDNLRYGSDDMELLQKILDDIDMSELGEIAPLSFGEIETLLKDIEIPEVKIPDEASEPSEITTIKIKLPTDKADEILAILSRKAFDCDYRYDDLLTNYGNALYHILILEGSK